MEATSLHAGSQLSDADFDALMTETFGADDAPQQEALSTETPPVAEAEAAPTNPQAAEAPATAEAVATDEVQASAADGPTDDPQDAETDESDDQENPWETDDNPYRQQALTQQQQIESVRSVLNLIQSQRQQQQFQQIVEALPTMDEEQLKQTFTNALAAVQQQSAQQAQALAHENFLLKEARDKEKVEQILGDRYQLTREERQKLATFTDANAAAAWAEHASANRKTYGQQVSELKAKLEDLKNAQTAQDRMASGVDHVGGTGSSGIEHGVQRAEDASDFDSFFAAWADNPAYVRR